MLDDAAPITLPVPEITPAEVDPVTLETPAEPEWTTTLATFNCPGEQAAQ